MFRLEKRTPVILIDVPGGGTDTILLYGHLDKQPEMDGWHFLEELHMRGLRRHTRVVIVSGHYDPQGISEDRKAHAHHVLPKPFEPTSLVDLVNDALSRDPYELYEGRDRTVHLAKLIDRIDEVLG